MDKGEQKLSDEKYRTLFENITGRKKTEEELRKAERFLESIFASIQDGIGVLDTDMNIISVNRTAL